MGRRPELAPPQPSRNEFVNHRTTSSRALATSCLFKPSRGWRVRASSPSCPRRTGATHFSGGAGPQSRCRQVAVRQSVARARMPAPAGLFSGCRHMWLCQAQGRRALRPLFFHISPPILAKKGNLCNEAKSEDSRPNQRYFLFAAPTVDKQDFQQHPPPTTPPRTIQVRCDHLQHGKTKIAPLAARVTVSPQLRSVCVSSFVPAL